MKTIQYSHKMPNGGEIILNRLAKTNESSSGIPIVIAHGSLSNAEAMQELGEYLLAMGFDCWLLEWGGHGHSSKAHRRQNFESLAMNDARYGIDKVLEVTGQPQVFWVSHSGGSHLPLMYLTRTVQAQSKIKGIVSIGSQSTDAAKGLEHFMRTCYVYGVSNLLGRMPQKALPMKTLEGEPTNLLGQWAKWNLTGRWLGKDGFNYLANLINLTVPVLIIAGASDTIAPPSGCYKIFESFGSHDKTWIECSIKEGFSRDYGHGQLIRGSATRKEIYPKIGEWLLQRVD